MPVIHTQDLPPQKGPSPLWNHIVGCYNCRNSKRKLCGREEKQTTEQIKCHARASVNKPCKEDQERRLYLGAVITGYAGLWDVTGRWKTSNDWVCCAIVGIEDVHTSVYAGGG